MKKLHVAVLIMTCPTFGQLSLLNIQQFYDDLRATPPKADVPLDQVNNLIRPLETANPADLVRVLPSIRLAALHANMFVSRSALAALLNITVARADSADVLVSELGVFEGLLNRPDAPTADLGLGILSYLRPTAPPQVIPILLRFAERDGADIKRQAKALAVAVGLNEISVKLKRVNQEEQIVPAVERFSRRNLDPQSRMALLDGIGLAQPTNGRLTSLVISGMRDASAEVRARSLYNLIRLGPAEIRKVSLDVERLRTQDPDADVRSEADKALRVMGGENPFPPGQSK